MRQILARDIPCCRLADTTPVDIRGPDLLFLDEPTTGFDPEARREFWALIESLKAEGATILLTTRYLEEAEALADMVGVINRGQMVAFDPPHELGGRPLAPPRRRVGAARQDCRSHGRMGG